MTAEHKHTPGPWSVDEDDAFQGWPFIPISSETQRICEVQPGENDVVDEVSRTNARLIAAAPDLLEALRNAAGFLDNPISRRRNDGDAFYAETVASIRAAIDKAGGRS